MFEHEGTTHVFIGIKLPDWLQAGLRKAFKDERLSGYLFQYSQTEPHITLRAPVNTWSVVSIKDLLTPIIPSVRPFSVVLDRISILDEQCITIVARAPELHTIHKELYDVLPRSGEEELCAITRYYPHVVIARTTEALSGTESDKMSETIDTILGLPVQFTATQLSIFACYDESGSYREVATVPLSGG